MEYWQSGFSRMKDSSGSGTAGPIFRLGELSRKNNRCRYPWMRIWRHYHQNPSSQPFRLLLLSFLHSVAVAAFRDSNLISYSACLIPNSSLLQWGMFLALPPKWSRSSPTSRVVQGTATPNQRNKGHRSSVASTWGKGECGLNSAPGAPCALVARLKIVPGSIVRSLQEF